MLPQDIENTLDKPSEVKPCERSSDRKEFMVEKLFQIPVGKI